ncbi:MAG: 50S ribosomal protein L18 [Geobacteraceae bacterium]
MSSQSEKSLSRLKRKIRVRKKIRGASDRPRLNIFKSAKHIYAQIIDDTNGATLASVSTLASAVKVDLNCTGNIEAAKKVGASIAKVALEKGITSVVFDRNGFLYHGRIKALADAARENGLSF